MTFRVGLMDSVMAARPTVDAFSRASYLAAVANRVDSYCAAVQQGGPGLKRL
jgi:hypothetical protein